jgi:hypothetical protein
MSPVEDVVLDLSISSEQAFYILVKAREFDEKTAPASERPASNPSDDGDVAILEDRADDPTFQELMAAMEALNEDQQLDLIALVWVGRGDFSIRDFAEARRTAEEMGDKHIPHYLAGTPLFSDYLEEALGQAGETFEAFEINRL